jgi:hypothetical protein
MFMEAANLVLVLIIPRVCNHVRLFPEQLLQGAHSNKFKLIASTANSVVDSNELILVVKRKPSAIMKGENNSGAWGKLRDFQLHIHH